MTYWWKQEAAPEPCLKTLVAETMQERHRANEELLAALRKRERQELERKISVLEEVVGVGK